VLNDLWKFITKFLGHITNVKIETNILCVSHFSKKDIKNQIYKQKTRETSILNYECENDSQRGHFKKK
jgi:hypothetical protein